MVGAMLILASSPCCAQSIQPDKVYHAGASAGVEWFMIHNKPFCKWKKWQRVICNVAVVGGSKELWDKRHSGHACEMEDLAADAAGAMAMEGFIEIVHFEF